MARLFLRPADPTHDREAGHTAERLLSFLPAIRRFLMKRAPAGEAEDLTQEVFARMLDRADVDGIKNIEGYLFRVAANVVAEKGRRDRVRHVAMHVELTEAYHPVEENSPERILLQQDLLKAMMKMIHDLPPRTQDAFVLHRFEEMTYEAVARHMGISVSAVEKHIMRAISHLTARMKALNE